MVESTPSIVLPVEGSSPSKSHDGCGSCGSGGQSRCGNGLEKIYPTTAIRFAFMRYIGEFTHAPDMKFTCGAKVVIQTKRGIEIGEQVSLTCSGCDKSVTRDQMKEWVHRAGEDSFLFECGRILREATATDLGENARIQTDAFGKRNFARQIAAQHKLPIKVVECECLFGGERIIFYFTAEERVDFRAMVKELATEYRTRIEMRQVGARDEARLLADYETCGREVCCKVFLKTLKPISMRMAKVQKATLDPSQVSGRCGRLKCCLRYEHVGYEELDKALPRRGAKLRTQHGEGVVINRQILTQLVQIRKEDGSVITVVAEDILAPGEEMPKPAVSVQPTAASDGKPQRSSKGGRSRRSRGRQRLADGGKQEDKAPGGHTAAASQPPSPPPTGGAGSKAESSDKPRRRRRRRRRRPSGGGPTDGGPKPTPGGPSD